MARLARARVKGNKHMAVIGDKVRVTIQGPTVLSGTATASGSTTIPAGIEITAQGTIVEDSGNNWIVELNGLLYGSRRITLPKDRIQ
jgi:hypothetical protein